jgi:hypothetical protein
VEDFISTYRFGGVIESGHSGRDSWSLLISVAKTLRLLPESYSYTQPREDSYFDLWYFSRFLTVAFFCLDLRFGKTCLVIATSHSSLSLSVTSNEDTPGHRRLRFLFE